MEKPLAIWRKNGKVKRDQAMKERVLKNREAVLDVMSDNIKGARQCSILLGEKCIGGLCEFFVEYKNVTPEGKTFKYNRCNFNQTPQLLIEQANLMRMIIQELRATQKLLIAIHEEDNEEDNDEGGQKKP